MNTENLIISEAPAAFADFAAKHNALVYLLAAMTGAGGITVVASEANIIVDGSAISVSAGSFSAVGSDGKLGLVQRHLNYVAPTTYPTVLRAQDTSVSVTANVQADSTGLTVTNASGKKIQMLFSAITYDITVREIHICDGSTTKHMLVLGSAAYA